MEEVHHKYIYICHTGIYPYMGWMPGQERKGIPCQPFLAWLDDRPGRGCPAVRGRGLKTSEFIKNPEVTISTVGDFAEAATYETLTTWPT
jgi:hypothetical protein